MSTAGWLLLLDLLDKISSWVGAPHLKGVEAAATSCGHGPKTKEEKRKKKKAKRI